MPRNVMFTTLSGYPKDLWYLKTLASRILASSIEVDNLTLRPGAPHSCFRYGAPGHDYAYEWVHLRCYLQSQIRIHIIPSILLSDNKLLVRILPYLLKPSLTSITVIPKALNVCNGAFLPNGPYRALNNQETSRSLVVRIPVWTFSRQLIMIPLSQIEALFTVCTWAFPPLFAMLTVP
jgi:hypothetical protein